MRANNNGFLSEKDVINFIDSHYSYEKKLLCNNSYFC